jgi:signal transduction histidine kinase
VAPTLAGERPVSVQSLSRLRWLTIVAPVVFLVVLDYARHRVLYPELHRFPGVLVLIALVSAGVAMFSFAVFGAIERLERRVLEQNQQLSALNEIAAASAENLELDELLRVALDKVLLMMKAEAGVICLLDTETGELVATCHRGLSDELAQRIRRTRADADPMGAAVLRTGCPVVEEHLFDHPLLGADARREGFRAAVSVPLKAEGEVSGVLAVITRHERRFAPGEMVLLTGIGGQLGLAVRNAMLFQRAHQRNEELAALLTVGRAAASSLDPGAMLDKALDAILNVTSAEVAEVWLLSEHGDLTLERQRSSGPVGPRDRPRQPLGEGIATKAAHTGEPVVIHDLGSDGPGVQPEIEALGFQSFCALPLRPKSETVGVLTVAARDREALCGSGEVRLLEGIGEQVAIALENARLHEQVLDVAVLEERERISRELHDGLAQVLGYINTQTLAIRKLLSSGRMEEAEREVRAIGDTARELYTDVREAILGLRASLGRPGELIPSLRTYLGHYEEMTGVQVQLVASEAAERLRLPASVEVQLMRIVQEALSNVRKHARATTVQVGLAVDADGLVLTVADDGAGFDPDRPGRKGWPRFGLQTMRERAEAVGGRFEIVSTPGRGTTACVRIPVGGTTEVSDASAAGR